MADGSARASALRHSAARIGRTQTARLSPVLRESPTHASDVRLRRCAPSASATDRRSAARDYGRWIQHQLQRQDAALAARRRAAQLAEVSFRLRETNRVAWVDAQRTVGKKCMRQQREPEIVQACRELYRAIDRLDQAAADQLGVLRNDLRCPNLLEAGPVAPTRIASELGLTSGGVTALVDRLQRKGLVRRVRDAHDRRGVRVQATAKVFRTIGALYRGTAEELDRAVASYPPEERALAVRHLSDVAQACDRARERWDWT